MALTATDRKALDELDARLRTLLPAEYQETYETVQPVSMGTAGLKYAADGTVAWDEIWGSFCDLAMAGGPPHKGRLLEPGSPTAIEGDRERFQLVVEEICRGVTMVTDLQTRPSPNPGWVRVESLSEGMAGWLLRAIVMENVAVRAYGRAIDLPAAPDFRLEKEIKNVITVIAKTCHYWTGHMPRAQRQAITALITALGTEAVLIEPAWPVDAPIDAQPVAAVRLAECIEHETGLRATAHTYPGWLGLQCSSVGGAVWMMRALVASNVLSRREETVLFVPVNAQSDPDGVHVTRRLKHVHHLAAGREVL